VREHQLLLEVLPLTDHVQGKNWKIVPSRPNGTLSGTHSGWAVLRREQREPSRRKTKPQGKKARPIANVISTAHAKEGIAVHLQAVWDKHP
jgi:hypothetical protein